MVSWTDTTQLTRRVWKLDRVVLASALLVAGLAVAAPAQALASLRFLGDALLFILPFLVGSVLIAAYAGASGLDGQVARAFAGRPRRAVVLAALFGALSPFCSCGVVPIIAGLLAAGVPVAPVMAFWIASPLMDPEMFVLTLPVLGLEFALAKTLAAIALGLGAGFATLALTRRGLFADGLRIGRGPGGCGAGALAEKPVVLKFWHEPARRALFLAEGRSAGWFLLKWLALAFLLESLMIAWLPADMVGAWLGGGQWWSVPASVLVGIPAYLNGYAAIPTVGALIDLGMAPAAALGFMIAGGATSIPAAVAVYALVRKPLFVWYVAAALAGSLLAAYIFQSYLTLAG